MYKNLDKLFSKGKTMILACDQGMEHGPRDFNLINVDPEYIMDIALEGRFNAVAVQAGVAEKYHKTHYKDVPLVVKLNGKTSFASGDPLSLQHTSVSYAIGLGATAVGYTIYPGSEHAQIMYKEFGNIVEEAHKHGVPVICWAYPRGKNVNDEDSTETIAYAARIAMELGADVVKIRYNGDVEGLKWIVKLAGRAKVVIAGGSKRGDLDVLKFAEGAISAGAAGITFGRNIWQSDKPFKLAAALKEIIFNGSTAKKAYDMHIKTD